MKKAMLLVASLGLASGPAVAQEQDTEDYDPSRDIVTEEKPEYDPGRDIVTDEDRKPQMSMGEAPQDSPVQTDYGSEESTQSTSATTRTSQSAEAGLTEMTAAELEGKTVVTLDGEEIGEIGDVGESSAHQERVATVEVGGFLGVGEKTIVIPLSELQMSTSDSGSVRTAMTRESIESQAEFDASTFTPDE